MPRGLSMVRRVLLSLGLALLLLAVVLALLPALLKPALNRTLPGLLGNPEQPASAVIEHLSWHRLTLRDLQLSLPDGSLVQLHNLDIRYQPLQLLQGRLNSLDLQRATLQLPAPSAAKVVTAAAINAGDAAREQFNQAVDIPAFSQWLQLPLERLHIHELNLLHPSVAVRLQVSLNDTQWRVHGDAQLDNLPLPWQVELQLQSSGHWLLLIAEQSQLLLQQYGQVQQDDHHTRIQLDQRLDLAALSERLPQLADLPLPLSQLLAKAELQLPNRGVLPRDLVLGSAVTLTTRAGDLPAGLSWQGGEWLLTLTKDQPDSDWQLRLSGSPQRMQIPASLSGYQALDWHSNQTLSLHCNAALTLCEGEGQLHNHWQDQNNAPVAALTLTPALNWQQDSALSLVLPVAFTLQQAGALQPDLPLQAAHLNGELIALLDPNGDWQLSSIPGFSTRITPAPQPGWQLPDLSLTLLPQLYLRGNLNASRADEQLSIEPLQVILKPATLRQPANRKQAASELQIGHSSLTCRPALTSTGVAIPCDISLATGQSRWQGWPVPDLHLHGPLQLLQQVDEQRLTAQLALSAALQQIQMRLNLQHDISAQRGSLQWHLNDVALNWNSLNLSDMTALTKLQLLDGRLSGQGWADWQQDNGWQITPDISLRADNLSAIYDNSVAIEQWNALLALRRPFRGDYLLDAQLSGQSLNPGIALKNLLARSQTRIPADFSWAQIDLYDLNIDVLGGRVHTPLIRFDSRKNLNAFGIELSRIQLAQIAALEPGSGVQASGTLDGLLPVVLTPKGPQVPAGNLFARDPGGVIRYQSPTADALGSSDQSVGFAMQILENFHYNQLQTGILYQPDGQLNLALQFQGKNPEFFGGQSTHLNVNLEYNLLDFLESLRVTQNVISTLEEKYQ